LGREGLPHTRVCATRQLFDRVMSLQVTSGLGGAQSVARLKHFGMRRPESLGVCKSWSFFVCGVAIESFGGMVERPSGANDRNGRAYLPKLLIDRINGAVLRMKGNCEVVASPTLVR
jgi:hypothetical protein